MEVPLLHLSSGAPTPRLLALKVFSLHCIYRTAFQCTSFLYIGSGAYFCGGTDDSVIKSPLPITCTQSMSSILAPLPLELLPYHLSTDVLAMVCGTRRLITMSFTLHLHCSYPCVQLLVAISRPECQRILPEELCPSNSSLVLCALTLLAAMLRHHALALVERCLYTLCQLGLLDVCHSLPLSASLVTLMGHFEPLVLFSGMTFLPSS